MPPNFNNLHAVVAKAGTMLNRSFVGACKTTKQTLYSARLFWKGVGWEEKDYAWRS